MTKISKEVKFNAIFQFNNSYIKLLKENLKNEKIAKEIKELFTILDVTK